MHAYSNKPAGLTYDQALAALVDEYGKLSDLDWNRNLYWSWLYALKPLLAEYEQQAKLARELWHQQQSDEALVRHLVENHARYTNSRRAAEILQNWAQYRVRFVKVFPKEYRRALGELAARQRVAA